MKHLAKFTDYKMLQTFAIFGCVAMLTLAGCGGGTEDEAPAEEGAPMEEAAAPEAEGAPADGGTIAGHVMLHGTAPARAELDVGADAVCEEMHGDTPLLSDSAIVSANGDVQWAFAYVKNPPEGDYAVPEAHAVVDQIGCRYVPHVVGMRAGQVLDVKSSDETTHNVRSFPARSGGNKAFNISLQGPGVRERKTSFSKPEMAVKLKCDIHPWMTGYVFAMAHPYYAVSDENGVFTIDGLPAGEYTLAIWHETFGEQETTVTVTDGAEAMAHVAFTASE